MVERKPNIRTIIDDYAEIYPDSAIEVRGEASVLDEKPLLASVFTELARNSIEQGAGQVTVTFSRGRITFEDDLVYVKPGDILANLNAERPRSSKSGLGGTGIWSSRKILQEHFGGSLTYRQTESGKIIAEAIWEKD